MEMRDTRAGLHEQYRRALQEYLSGGGEQALHQAYELGRQALASGMGLLELVKLHQDSLLALPVKRGDPGAEILPRMHSAGRFLVESLSPYEVLQLGNQESNAALRRLNGILEEEARRIAHVLHDEAAQLLATAYLELAEITRQATPPVREHAERLSAHLDQVREQLRRLSHELRPPILDRLGLLPALEFLADGYRKRAGLVVTLSGSLAERLPPMVETALYRAVQEAFNNVTRHAQARHVHIRVGLEGRNVSCSIRDDGVGFDPTAAGSEGTHGLGLLGIQERVASLDGRFSMDSTPGAGTELRLSIPLMSSA
jgi:signal transduction histidine kinase